MMLHLVLLVVVMVSLIESCPSGGDRVWVELGDSCYSTSKLAMDWGTAQEVSLVQSDNVRRDSVKLICSTAGTREVTWRRSLQPRRRGSLILS